MRPITLLGSLSILSVVGLALASEAVGAGDIKVDGDGSKLDEFVSYLDSFELWFNIVTASTTN